MTFQAGNFRVRAFSNATGKYLGEFIAAVPFLESNCPVKRDTLHSVLYVDERNAPSLFHSSGAL